MTTTKKTPREARDKIVQAANARRLRAAPYSASNLQRCVAMCRNRRLVKPDVLVAAGFKAHGPNYRQERKS